MEHTFCIPRDDVVNIVTELLIFGKGIGTVDNIARYV
jgi:hypothetical protein